MDERRSESNISNSFNKSAESPKTNKSILPANEKKELKFYQKSWFMWLMLIVFFPVGLFLLWAFRDNYSTKKKAILSAVFGILFLVVAAPSGKETQENGNAPLVSEPVSQNQQSLIADKAAPLPSVSADDTKQEPEQEEIDSYYEELNELVDKYEKNYQRFIGLNTEAASDSSVIRNENWRKECVQTIAELKKCNVSANELIAPDSLSTLDNNLKSAAVYYEAAMDLYAKGIDEFDSSIIDKCGDELDKGNHYMSFVLEELDRKSGSAASNVIAKDNSTNTAKNTSESSSAAILSEQEYEERLASQIFYFAMGATILNKCLTTEEYGEPFGTEWNDSFDMSKEIFLTVAASISEISVHSAPPIYQKTDAIAKEMSISIRNLVLDMDELEPGASREKLEELSESYNLAAEKYSNLLDSLNAITGKDSVIKDRIEAIREKASDNPENRENTTTVSLW